MKIIQVFKMAISALSSNKARSFLTMLGVIIGVFAVTILISLIGSATDELTGSIEGMGSNMITINVDSPTRAHITLDDLDELVGKGQVKDIASSVSSGAVIKAGTNNEQVMLFGVTSNFDAIQEQSLDNGRFLSDLDIAVNSHNAVIDFDTAIDMFGTNMCTGSTLKINGEDFTVVGVLEESADIGVIPSIAVTVPITTAQRMTKNPEIDNIFVQANTAESVDALVEQMEDYMMLMLNDEDYYSITNNAAMLDIMDNMTGIMRSVLAGIAGISLLVGGIGIMNIMLVSVTERTREIGVRKAIGARKSDILIQFIVEAVMLCVLGGVIGLGLGYLGAAIAGPILDIPIVITGGTVALAMGFSIAVGLIFGTYPANKASNLVPIEALRYE